MMIWVVARYMLSSQSQNRSSQVLHVFWMAARVMVLGYGYSGLLSRAQ